MLPEVPFPQELVARYRAAGYWTGQTLGEAFWASVDEHKERIAVVDGPRRITYRALGELVAGAASRLQEAGLEGKSAIFQLPNSLEFVVAYFGCLCAGVIPVACQPPHRRAEIARLVEASQAAAWFVPASFRRFEYAAIVSEVIRESPRLTHVFVRGGVSNGVGDPRLHAFDELMGKGATRPRSQARSSDVAVLQLSGGSTGSPKLIPRTHDDYLYVSRASCRAMNVDADTVFLGMLPLAHNFSLATPGIQGVLLAGGKVVVTANTAPEEALRWIAAERVTWVPAVPATLIGILECPALPDHDVSSVRALYVGGQRLNPEPAKHARAVFGDAVQQIFGMAEGLICCTRLGDAEEIVLHTQGRPISEADEIRIVDESGKPVAQGEIGEVEVRGPYTIRGYQGAGAINARAFNADGYYRTGDLARVHASGNVMIEGRRKDVINRGGEKIAADHVEALILECPAVSNVAVVPYPDRVLGERICAFVTTTHGHGLDLPGLVSFLRDARGVPSTHLPERLFVRDSLPLTPVGKVAKLELSKEAGRLAEAEAASFRDAR